MTPAQAHRHHVLKMDCSSRQWLAALAVGAENAPKEEFFKGLTEVEE